MSLSVYQLHLQKLEEFHQAVQKFEVLLSNPFPDPNKVTKILMALDLVNQTAFSITESMMKNSNRKRMTYETDKKEAQA